MKLIFWTLFFISAAVSAQTHNTITIGNLDSVYSTVLHENRKIWISLPDTSSPDGIFYPERFPVVYLLDGDENTFASVAVMLKQMGSGGGNTSFPKMILVGVPNTNRSRDLTPTRAKFIPAQVGIPASQSGGGENFISFIEKELMPHIDSVYPTAPYRLLMGHSFSALIAMHILINYPALFNAYLAIDPSMWWDEQHLLKQAEEVLQKKMFTGRSLFLAVANTMEKGMDTIQVKHDTDFSSLHIRSLLQLGHYLSSSKKNELAFNWKYYPDYGHGPVTLIAQYDGLRSIFDFYNFTIPFGELFDPSYKKDGEIAEHYREISRQMGYTVSPPEQLISVISHGLTAQKQFTRALYFLTMNIDNYPKSFHAYGDLGDIYIAMGDKQKAIDNYSKALSLYNFPGIKTKLDKLLLAK